MRDKIARSSSIINRIFIFKVAYVWLRRMNPKDAHSVDIVGLLMAAMYIYTPPFERSEITRDKSSEEESIMDA
jgi:hypothetical protein